MRTLFSMERSLSEGTLPDCSFRQKSRNSKAANGQMGSPFITGFAMNSNIINFRDLSIAREIIPFLRLKLRIMNERSSSSQTNGTKDVLIVAPCIVGDCLACLPAVETFANENQTSFDIVVSPDFRSLAERLKRVRHVFVANSSYNTVTERQSRVTQRLPSKYDLIIVLRLSREAFDLIKHIRCRNIISSDSVLSRYIVHMAKSSLLKRPVIQSWEMMFEVFGLNGVPHNGRLPSLFDLGANDLNCLNSFSALQGPERKVLVHTGSGWQVKLWSDDRWVNLLERIRAFDACRFIFVGKGDEEKATFERIQHRLNFKIHSLINAVNLWELFLVMKRSDCFIGIDSGPRNLAHYADLRSITLLSPAAVKNFMPFDKRDIVVERQNRFPANIINTRRGASLTLIGVEEVFEDYRRLLMNLREVPGK